MIDNYVFYKNLPVLDLHGETTFSSKVLIDAFLKEQFICRNSLVKIVHGIGEGTLKRMLPTYLKTHPLVSAYKADLFNAGVMIVEIKRRD